MPQYLKGSEKVYVPVVAGVLVLIALVIGVILFVFLGVTPDEYDDLYMEEFGSGPYVSPNPHIGPLGPPTLEEPTTPPPGA